MSQINLPNGIPPHINGVDSSHSSRDSSPSSRTMQQHPPPTTIPQSQLPPVRQLSQNFTNLHIKQATPSTSPKPVSTSTPVQHDPKPALSSDVSPIGTQAQLASLNNRNTNVPSSLPHQGGNRPQMVAQPRLAAYSNLQNQFNQNVAQNQGGGSNYSVGAVGSDHNSRASSVSASPVRDPNAGKPLSLINGAQADFNKFNAVRPPLNKQMTLPQQLTGHQFPDGVNKTNSLDSVYPYGSLQQQQQQIGVGSSQNLRNIDSIDQNLPPHTNPQVGSKFAPQTGGVNQQLAPSQYTSVSQNMPQSYANAGQKLQANTGSVGLTGSSQSQPNLYSRGVNPNTLPPAAGQNQNLPGIGNQNKQMGFQSQIGGVQQVPSSVGQNLHVNQNQSQQQNQKPNSQVLHSTQMPSNFNSGNQNQAGYANQNQPVTSMPPPIQGYNKNLPGGSFPPVNNRPGSAGQMNIASNQARTAGVGQLPPVTGSVGQYPGSTGQLPPGAGTARQFPGSTGQLPPGTGQYPGSTGQLPPGTGSVGQFPGSTGQLPPGTGSVGQFPGSTGQLPPGPGSAGQFPGQLPTGAGSVGQFTGQAGSQFPLGNAGQLTTGLGQFPPKNPGESQARTNLHANRYPTQQLNPLQQQQQRSQVYQQQPQGYQQAQPYQQPYQDYQSNLQKTQNLNQNYNYQQPSVSQMGFNKLWGTESYDLLQTPVILPRGKVETPRISLGNELLDNANCHPDIFRCTMTKIPESNSLLQKSRLPLGVLIHPFRDLNQLPVIQCNTIVRCRACRTYINPFVFFVDNKRWKCNLCYRQNELPEEFQYDPVTKTYGDPSRRPEVKASTIEYIAPAEYMLRPPQPAIYLFLMDVSRVAVESGYLSTVCSVLSAELSNLPGDARTHIGFIAYNSALHFYSLADGLSQPHEMTVLDVDEIFLPCPDNLLVNLQDRMELVGDLLAQLPNRFNQSYDTGSALGAALQAAHKMMSSTGGRVTVFQCTLPNVGPGMLSPREDPSQRAGSEAQHLNPANDFYKRLALECSGQQIAVDLFILNSQYVDIATISGISRFSGGCMHHYPLFKASRVLQNESFERSLRRYLTRKIGFEAVMRIRCSRGLSIHTFHGNFFVRSTDLLSLPNVNPDAGFGMQVAIEENLSDVQTVCFQAALLYTSSKGERRIRVHTLCLPIANNVSDIINSADQQCIIGLLAKMAVDRSMQSSLSDAREAFINVAIDILSSYKVIQSMGPSGSLMAPNCLRLLPLYISALLKNQAFRTGISTRLDDRVKAMCDMKTRPLPYLIQQIYPDLYPIHNLHEQTIILNEEEEPVPNPPRLHLSARSIDSNGAYLMDTGDHMILIICPAVNQTFLNQALGVPDYNSITDQIYELPLLENEHSQRLHLFVNYLNDDKPFRATLQVIRDNSQLRIAFLERLVEDRVETALSYHEFLQHLKTQVK